MHAPDVDATLLVLLGLRLKGFAPADALVDSVGLAHDRVREELERSQVEGWVAFRDGRLTGWSLTPAGRAEGQRRLAGELDAFGSRPVVQAGYSRSLRAEPGRAGPVHRLADEGSVDAERPPRSRL